jgi:hypothetical protein
LVAPDKSRAKGHLHFCRYRDAIESNQITVTSVSDTYPPVITSVYPSWIQSGGLEFELSIFGSDFRDDSTVLWNGLPRDTVLISETELHATILAADIATSEPITVASIQVLNPPGEYSNPAAFTIVCDAVEKVDSKLAKSNETVVVSTAPSEEGKAGVQAALTTTQSGESRSLTAGTYSSNPTSGTFFDVGRGFVDLRASGVEYGDLLTASFYYPSTITGAAEDNLVLLHFNGSAWVPTLSSGGAAPVKDTTDITGEIIAGGQFTVTFDATSTPMITELSGTVFAVTTPLEFDGFFPPIGGADATGGSYASPLRTFKLNGSIPVKFEAAFEGAPVLTGVHRLQVIKYSDELTAGAPIEARSSDQATTGNQFRLTGHQWHFNLDTGATAMSDGIWLLRAMLSDGSQHSAWIQLK